MNSNQAKQIPIIQYLEIEANKQEIFIISPLNRNEKTPSFKIDTLKNIWYDHSIGQGGNILDLVMVLNNCNFKEALRLLESKNYILREPLKVNIKALEDDKKPFNIKKIKKLENKALIDYLKLRCINIDIACNYLSEIYYTHNNSYYFALAFKNNSNTYEIRNIYFKGCIGNKDITTIENKLNKDITIFEGFIDYLSALTYYNTKSFKGIVIILNSLSNINKVHKLLNTIQYNNISLFLDNDKKGIEAKNEFKELYPNITTNYAPIYANYKDFNDMIVNGSNNLTIKDKKNNILKLK